MVTGQGSSFIVQKVPLRDITALTEVLNVAAIPDWLQNLKKGLKTLLKTENCVTDKKINAFDLGDRKERD